VRNDEDDTREESATIWIVASTLYFAEQNHVRSTKT